MTTKTKAPTADAVPGIDVPQETLIAFRDAADEAAQFFFSTYKIGVTTQPLGESSYTILIVIAAHEGKNLGQDITASFEFTPADTLDYVRDTVRGGIPNSLSSYGGNLYVATTDPLSPPATEIVETP